MFTGSAGDKGSIESVFNKEKTKPIGPGLNSEPGDWGVVQNAFHAAYLMTGSLSRAEEVILFAIERVEASRLYSPDLLKETVRLSAANLNNLEHGGNSDVLEDLPRELERVTQLESLSRCAFVARVLLQFTLADCVSLLGRDAMTIERAVLDAVCCLCSTTQTERIGPQMDARANLCTDTPMPFRAALQSGASCKLSAAKRRRIATDGAARS